MITESEIGGRVIVEELDDGLRAEIQESLSDIYNISGRIAASPEIRDFEVWVGTDPAKLRTDEQIAQYLLDGISAGNRLSNMAYWFDVSNVHYQSLYEIDIDELQAVVEIIRDFRDIISKRVDSILKRVDEAAGRLPGDVGQLHMTLPASVISNIGQAQAFMSEVIRKQAEMNDDGHLGELEIRFLDGSPTETGAYMRFATLEDTELPVEQVSYDYAKLKITLTMHTNPFRSGAEIA